MEIAGLVLGAVGLVPPTLQLIDGCATFYINVAHFGKDSHRYVLRFSHLRARYDALQRVLFQEGKYSFAQDNLFKSLPEQNQRLVYAMLQELASLLYKHYLISQTYEIKSDLQHPSSEEVKALVEALALPDASRTPSFTPVPQTLSLRHIWWATRGKRKAEKLLNDFDDWLRRIRDIIEDTWWHLPEYEVATNLEVIAHDKDAGDIGIASAAGLKQLTLDTIKPPAQLNQDAIDIHVEYLTPQRGIATLNNEGLLIEGLDFEPDKDGFIVQTLQRRFEGIATLLSTQEDLDMRVLRCRGYRQVSNPLPQFQLLMETPANCNPSPISLQNILGARMRQKPDLGQRFGLCWRLAETLSKMHSIGWLHRGLTSENVLCFLPTAIYPGQESATLYLQKNSAAESAALYLVDHFVVCGFDSSRLETDFSLGPYGNTIDKNIYRHPERWGLPQRTFSRIHDIYALGVVLLEIGLWERALFIGGNDFLQSQPNAKQTSHELLKQARVRLGHRCGNKFRDIVVRCLEGDFPDSRAPDGSVMSSGLQGKFRELVINPLERLRLEV